MKHYRIINERWLLVGEGMVLKSQDELSSYEVKLLNEIEIIKRRLDKLEEK